MSGSARHSVFWADKADKKDNPRFRSKSPTWRPLSSPSASSGSYSGSCGSHASEVPIWDTCAGERWASLVCPFHRSIWQARPMPAAGSVRSWLELLALGFSRAQFWAQSGVFQRRLILVEAVSGQVTGPGLNSARSLCRPHCSARVLFRPLATSSMA